jgi:hypothetical protein
VVLLGLGATAAYARHRTGSLSSWVNQDRPT